MPQDLATTLQPGADPARVPPHLPGRGQGRAGDTHRGAGTAGALTPGPLRGARGRRGLPRRDGEAPHGQQCPLHNAGPARPPAQQRRYYGRKR